MPIKLADKLRTLKKSANREGPLWSGPCAEGPSGGVTQSLLGNFLGCRERFRVRYIDGLRASEGFNSRLEFGSMWHVCEENLAGETGEWQIALKTYADGLYRKYPLQQEQVRHWYDICRHLFPLYVDHWASHPDVRDRTPLMQEQVFDVPYPLPSGRVARLRGKFDSVDLVGKGKAAGVYLQENKTKSSIDEGKLRRQLTYDLQTCVYLIALRLSCPLEGNWREQNILGVRYNVIRRSAHKTVDSMLKKIEEDRKAGRIGEWFARWKVEVSSTDIAKFKERCLTPLLENLCDWYEAVTGDFAVDVWSSGLHWQHPFGTYNPLADGGASDVDNYICTGDRTGLVAVSKMFEELQ